MMMTSVRRRRIVDIDDVQGCNDDDDQNCDDDDVITIISLAPVTKTVLTRVRGDDDDVLDEDCHVGDYG